MAITEESDSNTVARWSVGGVFLEALANRDYARMATTLGPAIRFRAMLPPGLMHWDGPDAVAEAFSSWFGDAVDFDLVDATVGEVGAAGSICPGDSECGLRHSVLATVGTSSNSRSTPMPPRPSRRSTSCAQGSIPNASVWIERTRRLPRRRGCRTAVLVAGSHR